MVATGNICGQNHGHDGPTSLFTMRKCDCGQNMTVIYTTIVIVTMNTIATVIMIAITTATENVANDHVSRGGASTLTNCLFQKSCVFEFFRPELSYF